MFGATRTALAYSLQNHSLQVAAPSNQVSGTPDRSQLLRRNVLHQQPERVPVDLREDGLAVGEQYIPLGFCEGVESVCYANSLTVMRCCWMWCSSSVCGGRWVNPRLLPWCGVCGAL